MAEPSAQLSEAWNLEEPLSEGQQLVRDNFVNEYLKDFSAYHAAIRCGFIATFAVDWARRLMGETYVQRKIAEMSAPVANEEEQIRRDRMLNEQHLRWLAAHASKESDRISAIRELNSMRGFNKPIDSADNEQALIEALRDFAIKAPV